ncbi:hypothetical protein [Streptomyces rhizosphaerihabitans]|uniref:hypothetical protein n=1 Tax=Streptomyces rhizosphaerihabitans TaxID=1266770 RepID=UPI0021BE2FBF|nr:hypothetical protein [Streptomyces rhizosphaerihabitans]MCT9004268.1 hypothetical protein [Streptomyces rhizosphaerihabitans]
MAGTGRTVDAAPTREPVVHRVDADGDPLDGPFEVYWPGFGRGSQVLRYFAEAGNGYESMSRGRKAEKSRNSVRMSAVEHFPIPLIVASGVVQYS